MHEPSAEVLHPPQGGAGRDRESILDAVAELRTHLFIADADGRALYANPHAIDSSLNRRAHPRPSTMEDFLSLPAEARRQLEAFRRDALEHGFSQGAVYLKSDGSSQRLRFLMQPFRNGGRPLLLVLLQQDEDLALDDVLSRFRPKETILDSLEEGVIGVDNAGQVIFANESARSLIGGAYEQLIGQDVGTFWQDKAAISAPKPREPGRGRSSFTTSLEGQIRTRTGAEVPVRYRLRQLRGELENEGVVLSFLDQSIIHRTRRELHAEERLLRAVLSNAPIILFSLDEKGVYKVSEGKGLTDLGLRPGEVVGRSVFEVHPGQESVLAELTRALNGQAVSFDAAFHSRFYRTNVFPHFDSSRRVLELTGVSVDITDLRLTEQALVLSEEHLRFALEGANEGMWDRNTSTGEAVFSRRFLGMLGYEPEDLPATFRSWQQLIHPDDREEAVRSILVRAASAAGQLSLEYRAVARDGSTRWIQTKGKPAQVDANGAPVRVVGTNAALTGRKLSEQRLAASEHRFRSYVEQSPRGIFVFDQRGTLVDGNEAAFALVGYAAAELLGGSLIDLLADEPREGVPGSLREALRAGSAAREIRVLTKDGAVRWVSLSMGRIHDDEYLAYVVDITRRFGLPEEQLPHIRRGALLPDIGKMAIPDLVLLKPGPLDEEEWTVMRRHPELGRSFLEQTPYLRPCIDIPYGHHERWDGGGYPRGLKGEEIPLAARLFSVVDCFDAVTSDRSYRLGWPAERARDYIREQAGTAFDPNVVEVFLSRQANRATGRSLVAAFR